MRGETNEAAQWFFQQGINPLELEEIKASLPFPKVAIITHGDNEGLYIFSDKSKECLYYETKVEKERRINKEKTGETMSVYVDKNCVCVPSKYIGKHIYIVEKGGSPRSGHSGDGRVVNNPNGGGWVNHRGAIEYGKEYDIYDDFNDEAYLIGTVGEINPALNSLVNEDEYTSNVSPFTEAKDSIIAGLKHGILLCLLIITFPIWILGILVHPILTIFKFFRMIASIPLIPAIFTISLLMFPVKLIFLLVSFGNVNWFEQIFIGKYEDLYDWVTDDEGFWGL